MAKFITLALLALSVSFLATGRNHVYAANTSITLSCDGSSSYGASVDYNDTVSFTSGGSTSPTFITLGVDTLSLGQASTPLSGSVSFSDDCGDSGFISVNPAPTPPPPLPSPTPSPSPSTPAASTTQPSDPNKPTDPPPPDDPTATLGATTSPRGKFSFKSSPAVAASYTTVNSHSINSKKIGIGSGLIALLAAIGFGIYYLTKRCRKFAPVLRPAPSPATTRASIPTVSPFDPTPVEPTEPPAKPYRPKRRKKDLGGPFSIGG